MSERRIDLSRWPRAAAYAHYRPYAMPHMAMTADIDVTALKASGGSFFARMLHATTQAVNAVPELRQRIRVTAEGEEVVEHDAVDPAFTVAVVGGLFNFASVPFVRDLRVFEASVAAVSDAKRTVRALEPFDGVRDDVVYMSCLPWVSFSSLTHPVASTDDCVPRVAWGRFTKTDGRVVVPVNLQVHHALVDGVHMARFFETVQAIASGGEAADAG